MITADEVKEYIPKLANITIGSVTTISFNHGVSTEEILDSGNGFVAAGFLPGHQITVTCSLDQTNEGVYTIVIVSAGTLVVSETVTTQSAAAAGTVRINGPDTDYTEKIERLIPRVENKICALCRNHFAKVGLNKGYFASGFYEGSFVTIDGDAKTITFGQGALTDYQFAAGDDIYMVQSLKNDGHYNIKSLTDTIITVEDIYTLKDESAQEPVEIYYVDFPYPLKSVLARMIEYELLIKPLMNPGVTSESIEGVSYTKDGKEYPGEILGDLSEYTKERFV